MIDRREMPPLEASIWNFIRTHFLGVENAAPRGTVRVRYNLSHRADVGDREFRDVIAQLVTVYKKPICTTPHRGYYVARTEAEKQEALHYLDSVLSEIADRRRALADTDPLERQERLFP
jgi:hypothetical protein